eukprot:751076-Hanusia_phi.AAC.1
MEPPVRFLVAGGCCILFDGVGWGHLLVGRMKGGGRVMGGRVEVGVEEGEGWGAGIPKRSSD